STDPMLRHHAPGQPRAPTANLTMPIAHPLTDLQIAEQLPALGIRNGATRPHVRGKLREYIVL
ncbi:MAG TPA: hypothetical protein VGI68_22450, partial [Mycobacterium sp.]